MADLYSTNFLMKILEELRRPTSFLLDRFFPEVSLHDTEEIHFDVINSKRRLAPFVSPMVAGRVVQELGLTTNTFKPAYVKPKTPLEPGGALKRSAGEQIGGSLSAGDRQLARMARTVKDHIEMIMRRMEWMAAEVLRVGQVTISGEEYQTTNVNFGRDAALTVTLAGALRWDQAGINPLDDLQNWALTVLQKSGASPIDVVMDVDTWKIFRNHADVKARLDTRHVGGNAMRLDAVKQIGGTNQGFIDGFNIFSYAEWYLDDAGVEQPMLPSGTVLMSSRGLEGVRAHGAILDDSAGLRAMEFYPKTWVPEDPAIRQVMTQSAPLIVPTRVNASFAATVL